MHTNEEPLELTGSEDNLEKQDNTLQANISLRCACGGSMKSTDNLDSSLFFGADNFVVIPLVCEICEDHGLLHVDFNH